MNSDKQSSNPAVYQPQPVYEDEISLIDIVSLLLRRKKLILGITVIAVSIGLLYAFIQKRVYQVETILSPPSIESIQSFNLKNLQNITEDKVYSNFIETINTRMFRKEFFDKSNLIKTLSDTREQELTAKEVNDVFEEFSDSLKISKISKISKNSKNSSIRITLEGSHKEKIGPWLDDFIALANEMVISQLVHDIEADKNYKIKKLKRDIKNKRLFYKQRRKDELQRLNEDYQIAKILGVTERNDSRNIALSNNNLSIYMSGTKRYMEGTKILQAEINRLKNRKSDDIYIAGLRDLQEQIVRLDAIVIEKDKLQTVIVNKKAVVNIKPIRPNRKLLAILSFVLGGMLAIFAVFILEFISNLKKQVNNKSDFDAV